MTDLSPELRALAAALGRVPAPCQTADPDSWYGDHDTSELAASICRHQCHALPECAALAQANGEQYGVWGGQVLDRHGRRKEPAA